jgi:ADP-dependent NAD(P)H-hydrate dehydratase
MPSLREATPVTPSLLRGWPLPAAEGDKDNRGRTLIVGGSRETGGAVLLAAVAALRSGAGKLQVAGPESLQAALTLGLPEALVRPLPETPHGALSGVVGDRVRDLVTEANSVLVGPGLTDTEAAVELTRSIIDASAGPLALDALALAAVTADVSCVQGRPAVLTPNRDELARCAAVEREEVEDDPCGVARDLAERTGAVVSVGGHTAYVVEPDGRAWTDSSGGVGLGVSGSGDVHAGVVAGLLARGAEPAQAAVWAVHLHGRAGERLASTVGRLGYLARELPAVIPAVLVELEQ